MLELKNVKKDNDILSADYCYADEKDVGHVTYDIIEHDFVNIKWNRQDEQSEIHYGFKVKDIFERMIELNKFPDHYTMLWY